MRRHLPRLLLTGVLLSPVTLYALGLGEIRLNSALNQPFDADIELLSPTPEELGSLKVTLASADVFTRYGIDRPAYLGNFDFSVTRARDGRATIKVTSSRSVTEPFVTLLVEANWARGRLVREYTLLLDPPVFMPSQTEAPAPAPVTTPQSGAPTEGRIERRPVPPPEPVREPIPTPSTAAEQRVPEPAQTERPQPLPRSVAAAPGSEYTVQRNDTLYQISAGANPGPRRVVNKTMIAVFRANPQAFNGNINRLRAGSVLRIPELTEIDAVSTDEASSEVARQTAEWSGASLASTGSESNRLRLVTPAETPAPPTAAPAPSTQTPGQPSASSGTSTPSAPDKRLEIKSPGLADVQRAGEPVQQPPVEAETPAPTPEASAQTPPAETPAAEQPAPAATPPVARPTPPVAPEPSLLDRIGDFWWVLVGLGLLVVVGLLLAFIRRRREEEEEASLDALAPMSFDPPIVARRSPALAPSPAKGRDRADAFLVEGEDTQADLDEPPPVMTKRSEPAPRPRAVEPVAAPKAAKLNDDTLSSETQVRFDQQDALAEADFHMAYGLYDQAADLVKIAIDREPSRRDLKLKLLEIYFVWGNRDLFLDTARDLHASRGSAAPGEWDKVAIMGKQIAPEDPMFKGGEGGHVDLVDVNLEGGENRVDVDLFAEGGNPTGLDLEFTSGERKGPRNLSATNNGDLDFLLDESANDASEDPTRELDPLARTQETPTIESPMINRGGDRAAQTIREKTDRAALARAAGTSEQTAELSIDDLGLDVDALDASGSLEDTTSLKDADDDVRPLRDDEMTQLAPSLGSFDRTMEAPRVEKFDIESTGTIYIDQVDLSGGDTAEHPRIDADSTASMKLALTDIDLDLDDLTNASLTPDVSPDTLRQPSRAQVEDARFSDDVFADRTSEVPRVDLDVGDPLSAEDREPTNRAVITTEMELSELDPVTMSEVGTKLDLARAYMDMGDPDGARSILDEVLSEGNPGQKQEAQRLMDSIR
jgi:pilus assembly protein FimV